MKQQERLEKNLTFLIVLILFILIFILSLLTSSLDLGDIGDYAGVSKFFSGELNSKIRSSHSYLYGLMHSPLISLTKDFKGIKMAGLIYLALIALSLYFIS